MQDLMNAVEQNTRFEQTLSDADESLQPIEIVQSKRRFKLRGFFGRNKNNQ